MMDIVVIKNLRESKPLNPFDVRVDRSSPIGNPFFLADESERDQVCEEYHRWFWRMVKRGDMSIIMELDRLLLLLDVYKILRLYCWCAPKRCHAETIKQYLLEIHNARIKGS